MADLKDPAKILAYLVAVIVIGALLAPWLYWAGQALAAQGVFPFLAETDFQKFFNRSVLIAAVALLWPTVRWLRITGISELGLTPDNRWLQRSLVSFGIAAAMVLLLGVCYEAAGIYRWKEALPDKPLPWNRLPMLLVSAVIVSLVEEGLFRGGILGLFRRTLSPLAAIILASGLFSIVHFLKPDSSVTISNPNWVSGFAVIPHTFHQFTEPLLLLGSFTTLFALGLILADLTVRTRSLWMAVGLHAGLVFAKMSFSKFTKRNEAHLPWIGEELQIGLIPVIVLILVWQLARFWLRCSTAKPLHES